MNERLRPTPEEQELLDEFAEREGLPDQSFHIEEPRQPYPHEIARGAKKKLPHEMLRSSDPSHVPMFRTPNGFKIYPGWREDEH